MRTYQEFVAEAYNREYDRRGPRPVRGRDYEDFKGLPKPSGNLGGQFQSKDKRPSVHPAAHLKPKKKSAAERMDAAGKRLGLPEENVQELFITRKSPEQKADEKRKKKVAELIRLMKHAKDAHTDVARKPVAK